MTSSDQPISDQPVSDKPLFDQPASVEPAYQSGFGNEFASEAVAGALPVGQNNPQKPPLGRSEEVV